MFTCQIFVSSYDCCQEESAGTDYERIGGDNW